MRLTALLQTFFACNPTVPIMFWIFLALVAGTILPVQAAINATLRAPFGHPVLAALASFAVGTFSLAVYALAARLPLPTTLSGTAPWQWSGGFIGAIFVSLTVILAPRLGTATLFSLIICGQLLISLALDHFGWLGLEQHTLNAPRVLGAVLLVVGVVLIRNF